MKSYLIKLALLLLALLAPLLQAQRFAPLIAVKVGAIRNWQQNSLPPYSFYPEFEVEHKLFALGHDSLLISLAVYGSSWDDGVEKAARNCSDCITYSTSEQVLGMRLGMLMAEFPLLPLGFYGGMAQRRLAFEYVAGAGINGEIGHDLQLQFYVVEAGAFVRPRLLQRWHLIGEVQRMFPFQTYETSITPVGRWAFKIGLAFAFGK